MSPSALITTIKVAFPVNPLPEMSLRQAELADSSLTKTISDKDWQAARKRDGHVCWRDISDQILMDCEPGLAHLDEASFAYYLGAFLRFLVTHVDADISRPEGNLNCTIMFNITQRSNHSLARFKRLSDTQVDCVIAVLRFVAAHSPLDADDAAKALSRYWLKPEARNQSIIKLP